MNRTAPQNKELSAPYISNARVERSVLKENEKGIFQEQQERGFRMSECVLFFEASLDKKGAPREI